MLEHKLQGRESTNRLQKVGKLQITEHLGHVKKLELYPIDKESYSRVLRLGFTQSDCCYRIMDNRLKGHITGKSRDS